MPVLENQPIRFAIFTRRRTRLRAFEDENAKLKRLLAEAMLDNAGLNDLLAKNVWSAPVWQARGGRASPGIPGDERAAGVLCHMR